MLQALRSRRWLVVVVLLLGAFALVLAWWVNRQLEPNRLAATVLDRVGQSLQLRFGFDGTPEYAFRPEPRLVLPGLTVAGLEGEPFLTAKRAEISLPWATITGGEPVITRVLLDTPVLHVDGLLRWIDARPKEPLRLPTLTHGLELRDGTILGDGYSLRKLALELPSLRQGKPADLSASGSFAMGSTKVSGRLQAHLATAGLASAYTLQFDGNLEQSPKPLPMKLASSGQFESTDAGTTLNATTFAFSGDSPLPKLSGKATLQLDAALRFGFDGVLKEWPAAWPALPTPLDKQSSDLPLQLSYSGRKDFSEPVALHIAKAATVLDANVRIDSFREWAAASAASPLPPITGTMRTPILDFDGIKLEGVEAEIRADAPTPTPTTVPAPGAAATATSAAKR
ncbi:hypothetical protein BH11PSE14_BH11PSE14_00950 [soil metagenome]